MELTTPESARHWVGGGPLGSFLGLRSRNGVRGDERASDLGRTLTSHDRTSGHKERLFVILQLARMQ